MLHAENANDAEATQHKRFVVELGDVHDEGLDQLGQFIRVRNIIPQDKLQLREADN